MTKLKKKKDKELTSLFKSGEVLKNPARQLGVLLTENNASDKQYK